MAIVNDANRHQSLGQRNCCGVPPCMYIQKILLIYRRVAVQSDEIASVTLHRRSPLLLHVYVLPFLFLYPLLAYTYYVKYDEWVKSEEWTFVYTAGLLTAHALTYLATHWSVQAKALSRQHLSTQSTWQTMCVYSPIRTKGRVKCCAFLE